MQPATSHLSVVAAPFKHYENFPVASLLCPAHLRAPVLAIYHFARTADDLADEGDVSPAQRLQDLHAYRQDLIAVGESCARSKRWPQVFAPLRHAIAAHQLPIQLLHDLLDAFEQDVVKTRDGTGYATQADLLDYCRRSANPIGRLLLHLYGITDVHALRLSDDICSALQLINFWQDPSVDLSRGRNYFVQENCLRFGVLQSDLLVGRATPAAARLVAANVASARVMMQNGAPLVHLIGGRAGWELRLVAQGGLRILDKIEALHFATLTVRPTLRWWDFSVLLWRALWM
jgi:squalene synthase HpnC